MKTRAAILFLATISLALAHPMGNFSISHYARLTPVGEGVRLTYALDLAEIPSFELLREWKLERTSAREELDARALEQAREWVGNLVLTVDGRRVRPVVRSVQLEMADGAGSLPVLRITAKAWAATAPGRLQYEDRNYPERAGWKEIVVDADGRAGKDLSRGLTAYPEDAGVPPPQDVKADFAWAAKPRAVEAARPAERPAKTEDVQIVLAQNSPAAAQGGAVQRGDTLSQLLGRQELGLSAMMLALALAFGFGAMHAMSPGHGKTIVAAYLVGSRGTFRHALFLGAMVTFTHTVSVFLLGLGTLFLSRYIVPDKIYPILSTVSGVMIVWIGGTLFYKRLQRLAGHALTDHHHVIGHHHHHDEDHEHAHAHAGHTHDHSHSHGSGHRHTHDGHTHSHDHGHGHDHDHGPGGHSHVPEGEVTLRSLVGLAVSGGMVPCPSALVLLLSAVALGRIGFGLALLTSFSLGLALVLIAIGVVVLYAKNLLPATPRVTGSPMFRMLPVISAAVITLIGLLMTAAALGLIQTNWT
ncbi:MAG: hypothetical protein JNK48_34835 [Bryobacterales bacterium]|nr:hypothetical protein [Bryobacterales bacterium]